MGLLDEAIRDHLQLKREHGTDPGEIARLENEALSPPVRETQEAPEGTRAAEPPPEAAAAAEPAPAPDAVPEAPLAAEPPADEPPAADLPADPPADEPPAADLPADPPASFPAETVGPPTVAFDAQKAAAEPPSPPGAPEGEDVLEETPEFLQETPEHDRLWFEQKPPRDFDFDG